jgi:hypothetical protein
MSLVFVLSAGCSAAPFGRTVIPTARPLTATASRTASPERTGSAERTGTADTPSTTVNQGTAVPLPTNTAVPLPTGTAVPLPQTLTLTPSPQPSSTSTPTGTPAHEPIIAVVVNDFTNVYSGPGLDYAFLAVLTGGFRIEVIGTGESGAWLVVRLPRGAQGWVTSSNLAAGLDTAGLSTIPSPPRPVPTGTTIPAPAVVVSPNALAPDAKYTIFLSNFIPYERITLRIVLVDTGSVVFKLVTGARVDGTQEVILRTSPNDREGAYQLTATGDNGSYAGTQFYVGPPPAFGDD